MLVRIIAISLVLLAAPVRAQEADDDMLQTSGGLSKALRLHGIEPAKVRWQPIESACSVLKDGRDQLDYNRCRFTKATDAQLFQSDRAVCRTRARADYPESLTVVQSDVNITINQQGAAPSAVYKQSPLTRADLAAKRDAAHDACMLARGWRDTRDPMMGRDKP